ncbi:hypothetical protein FRC04_010168 [Tulasnella sp. 424]|nr:hypothetical protein FRC04_010168 [Tulasnella sp. 424]KAG8972574.1 hypothetical protein FRC05_009807 [Tulasnella sp. 425]
MAPRQKEPTKNQYSKGLGYQAKTPAFILAMQQRLGGNSGSSDLADNGLGDGRPPIPTRPDGEGERGDSEESGDEKPQVVVLREGKHLTDIEVENEKRRVKGLPPLADKKTQEDGAEDASTSSNTASKDKSKTQKDEKPIGGLAFSSSKSAKSNAKKRKVGEEGSEGGPTGTTPEAKKAKTKKPKKETKALLSFGDGED